LIYLTGGLTSVLLERLKSKSVDRLLHRYDRVIVGRSAGALALCKQCILTDRNKQVHKIIMGLRLVEFSVKVHYDPSKDNDLRGLSKEEKIYVIQAKASNRNLASLFHFVSPPLFH
jgi:peptidase E